MAGAVLNTINTRLDAADHRLPARPRRRQGADRRPRVLQGGRRRRWRCARSKPLVIDYDDPEFSGAGERLGEIEYEDFIKDGDPDFAWAMPDDEWDAITLNYTSGTTGDPKGVVYHHRGALSARRRQRADRRRWAKHPRLSLDAADVPLQRLVLSLDDLGGRRHACLPARRCAPRRCTTPIAEHKVTHLCGAPIVMSTLLNAPADEKKPLPHVGRVLHRRRAAAGGGAGGDEGGGLQRHPCLRADRDLRPGRRQRMARRLGRAAARRAGGEEGAAGRALSRRSKRSTCSIPTRCSRCRATARRSAR